MARITYPELEANVEKQYTQHKKEARSFARIRRKGYEE